MESMELRVHNMIVERMEPFAKALNDLASKISEATGGASKEAIADLLSKVDSKLDAFKAAQGKAIKLECRRAEFSGSVEDAHPAAPVIVGMLDGQALENANIYVYGEAGTGKTTAAIHANKSMGLDLHMTGAALSKYDLIGSKLPSGDIVETSFMRAWINGGVIILDDIDRSVDKALAALNAAIANGYLDLTHLGMGLVKRHKDCLIIATGNTAMSGMDKRYSAASKQDGAFRDRFMFLRVDLDENLEMRIAGNKEWAKRVQYLRKATKELPGNVGQHVFLTMRATIQGSALLENFTQAEVEEMVILKGCPEDVRSMLYEKCGKPSTAKGKLINVAPKG